WCRGFGAAAVTDVCRFLSVFLAGIAGALFPRLPVGMVSAASRIFHRYFAGILVGIYPERAASSCPAGGIARHRRGWWLGAWHAQRHDHDAFGGLRHHGGGQGIAATAGDVQLRRTECPATEPDGVRDAARIHPRWRLAD